MLNVFNDVYWLDSVLQLTLIDPANATKHKQEKVKYERKSYDIAISLSPPSSIRQNGFHYRKNNVFDGKSSRNDNKMKDAKK